MTEQVPSDRLYIVERGIEFTLTFVACVALKALSPDPFYAGWFGGIIFACVYWRVWKNINER